jgi:outer membrane protein assembly factor BamC
VYTSRDETQTVWVPRAGGVDRDLEAEMLGRLLAKLAEPTKPAPAASPAAPRSGAMAAAPPAAPATPSLAALDADGRALLFQEGFERGWRRVGLALDRVGFTVEDRDRTAGTYFVRYIDPEAPAATGGPGMVDKLAFWRPAPKAAQPQYRIRVEESPPGTTRVTVQNAKGEADNSSTGKRILNLLLEQLR